MSFIKKNWSGMLLCLAIAIPAWYLGKLFPVVGGPVLAILIGLLVAMIPRKPALQSGITFTSKKVLQYAIILLGFDMNLFHILEIGRQSLLIIVVTISTALIVAYLVSRLLKIPSKTAILIGVGSSICGGSAIAATAPVIDADDEDVAKSISTIFLFNVLAAYLFCRCRSHNLEQRRWQRYRFDFGYHCKIDPHPGHHSNYLCAGFIPLPQRKTKCQGQFQPC